MCQIFAKNVIQNEIKGATIVNVSSLVSTSFDGIM